ncbi:enhancer of yellow 2b transcription factor isoform X1 [Drosophila novamexicana]|uniref:enhancer of yellow 2b transcription factor isoform X1 n=1 Tax=Drosophila novamexicana TaxID=47314 RepID=UPI0011E58FBA|nr:enhancer of yellow 2b transcription factor isoform X1 [Drosophila novamexicana]
MTTASTRGAGSIVFLWAGNKYNEPSSKNCIMENSKETGIGTDSAAVDKATLNTGDTMALKDLLEKRLIDCGWRKEIEQLIRNTLEERGVANITHDQLAAMIIPNARALVPDVVRQEMLLRVREALQSPLPPPGKK